LARRRLVATAANEPPSSELARAAAYCLHWTALGRFVDDVRLSPDNNLCEQQLRDIALGRNYANRRVMRNRRRALGSRVAGDFT
jgi:hypothetical protein